MECRVCLMKDHWEIWVPRNATASDVDDCVRSCRGHPVVIYRSGQAVLSETASALLQANRHVAAER